MSRPAPQLCWLITHLTLWRRWSLWTDTMRWKCLDRDWELCRGTCFCVKTLHERLSGECVAEKTALSWCFSGDSLLMSLSALLETSSLCFCGFSCAVLVVSAHGHSRGLSTTTPSTSGFCSLFGSFWVCVLLSETSTSSKQVMMGAGLAGLMGRWRSVGNQGLKTGGVRQGKDSRSFSVLSIREPSPAADPGW